MATNWQRNLRGKRTHRIWYMALLAWGFVAPAWGAVPLGYLLKLLDTNYLVLQQRLTSNAGKLTKKVRNVDKMQAEISQIASQKFGYQIFPKDIDAKSPEDLADYLADYLAY